MVIKLINEIQSKILKLLLKNTTMTRYELEKESKIPRTTLYDNLEKLLNMNYVNRTKRKRKSVGRPSIIWYIEWNKLNIIKEKGFFSNNNKFINQN